MERDPLFPGQSSFQVPSPPPEECCCLFAVPFFLKFYFLLHGFQKTLLTVGDLVAGGRACVGGLQEASSCQGAGTRDNRQREMCVYVCVCHLYLYVLICGSDREQTVKLMCVPACLLKKQCNIPMGILFPRSSISLLLLFCSILRLISGGAMLSLRKSNVLDLFSAKKSGNPVSEDYRGKKISQLYKNVVSANPFYAVNSDGLPWTRPRFCKQ